MNNRPFKVYWQDHQTNPEVIPEWEFQESFATKELAHDWISEQLPGGFYRIHEVYIL